MYAQVLKEISTFLPGKVTAIRLPPRKQALTTPHMCRGINFESSVTRPVKNKPLLFICHPVAFCYNSSGRLQKPGEERGNSDQSRKGR